MSGDTRLQSSKSSERGARRGSWRLAASPRRWHASRHIRGGLVVFFAIALAGWLLWIVLFPVLQPAVHLVGTTGGEYETLHVPPIAFAAEDLAAFEPLGRVLATADDHSGPGILASLNTAGDMAALRQRLVEISNSPSDVLIVYVNAHGVSEDGTAYLLCKNFAPESAASGRYRFADLLQTLQATPAATKLLILDAGRLDDDPRLGLFVNEFARLAQQDVQRTRDPSLWVMSANSVLEQSHVSRVLERSVFGHFVARGLAGTADLDGNGAIDVGELYRYVAAHVTAWVQQFTQGNSSQSPTLVWGGGSLSASVALPILLPVAGVLDVPTTVRGKNDEPKPEAKKRTESFAGVQPSLSYPSVPLPGARMPGLPVAPLPSFPLPTLGVPGLGGIAPPILQPTIDVSKVQAAARKALVPAPRAPSSTIPVGESKSALPPGSEKPPANAAAKETATEKDVPSKDSAAPAGTEPAGSKGVLPPSRTVPELLADAWQLRDALASQSPPLARPADFAPHLWHEFEEWLLAIEQRYLSGKQVNEQALAEELRDTIESLQTFTTPQPHVLKLGTHSLAERLAELLPHDVPKWAVPPSLAVAELLALHGGVPVSPETNSLVEQWEQIAAQANAEQLAPSREEIATWVMQFRPTQDRLVEFRLARQLASLPDLKRAVMQQVWQSERLSERLAACNPRYLPWIAPMVEQGDRLRLAGQRELLDRIGSYRQQQSLKDLEKAAELYQQAGRQLTQIRAAILHHHYLLQRATYYVRWHRSAGAHAIGDDAPTYLDLAKLLESLAQLTVLLESPDPATLSQILELDQRLILLQQQVESGLEAREIAGLTSQPARAESARRIDHLLGTPLVSAAFRLRLLAAASAAETAAMNGFGPVMSPRSLPSPRPVTRHDWQFVRERVDLECKLMRLAAIPGPPAPALTRLEEAHQAFLAAFNRLEQDASLPADDETLWVAGRDFGAALKNFYHHLPAQIEETVRQNRDLTAAETRDDRLRTLRGAEQALALVDARDARQIEHGDAGSEVRQAGWYDFFLWRQQRTLQARGGASPADAEFLSEAARAYRAEAGRIAHQPPLIAVSEPQLVLSGSKSLNLATESEQEMEFSVKLMGAAEEEVWVVLKFDPQLLEIRLPSESRAYEEHSLALPGAAPTQIPNGAISSDPGQELTAGPFLAEFGDLASRPPTFKLQSGSSDSIRFKVRGKAPSADSARILVKAISRHAFARLETEIRLPNPEPVELRVLGVPGTVAPSDTSLLLYPFPNQRTEFRFELLNHSLQDKTLGMEILALDNANHAHIVLPKGAISATDASALLGRFGSTRSLASLAKVSAPVGGEPVLLPFPKPADEEPALPADEGAAKAEGAVPAANESAKPAISIVHGLLVVITEEQSQLKTIRRIELAPQRPRRYVRPRVGYDPRRERIVIRVVPQDAALIPPGGVKIRGELLGDVPPAVEARLDGHLKAPDFEADLFAGVPAEVGRVLTLRLDVDGYPRAFIYRVPCHDGSVDLPEVIDLLDLRVTSPPTGLALKTPTGVIPMQFQVDAPLGAFQHEEDLVEVGIDMDRDRDFRGEKTLRFAADRQVAVSLDRLAPGGVVTVLTKVGDFKVDLPPPNLTNSRVGVLGRVSVGGKTAWSESREIVLDGSAPRIDRIELNPPGEVTIGKELIVSVWATDGELSGVGKVEVALDVAGIGKFAKVPPPMPAKLEPSGRWTVKLPTAVESGSYRVLVRATDKVGNESEYSSVVVRALTADEALALRATRTNRVSGTVLYGEQPVPGIEIKLAAEKGAKIPPVVTDERGNFTFPTVPPGEYKLTAQGQVRNKVRKAEAQVAVEPPPARGKPLRLTVK
jgi:hypothetical protein